ncbi:DNA topology modulation protein [Virgibacillus sp. SK37]|uniref:DNA topology modulation protein n=1 Tax=Virgibacillus sp. SK37 TaxID=403957 RepID=UPI0004D0D597|nr:DNA topology modulation protein [Virgibacillus sp. SK37]AIF42647.1 topology modulation protein [Virgibacillus sp. SK37]
MKKIAIIGSGGSGKSTLATKLGHMLHLPVFHLDAIFWKPGWEPIEREELIKKSQRIIEQNAWIIDGNYSSTMDIRLQHADTVIFLHYKTSVCLYGIVKRRIQFHNKTRPDMGENCKEKLDWEFFQWVRDYNKTKAPAVYDRLSKLEEGKNIYVFKKRKDLNRFLRSVESASSFN